MIMNSSRQSIVPILVSMLVTCVAGLLLQKIKLTKSFNRDNISVIYSTDILSLFVMVMRKNFVLKLIIKMNRQGIWKK